MNGFGWEQPSPLSPEIQTKAARFVSRYKVEETSSFPLYGSNLRIFIQCLGQIFKELHRNERLTLGEPEPNHFTMDALDSLDHRDVLDCAITCSALQELPQTKGKEALNTHVLDYHLNKIYTPYFEISYFKKGKLFLQILKYLIYFPETNPKQSKLQKHILIDIGPGKIQFRKARIFRNKQHCFKVIG